MKDIKDTKFNRKDILMAHFLYFNLCHVGGITKRDKSRKGRKTASSFMSRFNGNKRHGSIEKLYCYTEYDAMTVNGRRIFLKLLKKYETQDVEQEVGRMVRSGDSVDKHTLGKVTFGLCL
jgi:hypothetical protein